MDLLAIALKSSFLLEGKNSDEKFPPPLYTCALSQELRCIYMYTRIHIMQNPDVIWRRDKNTTESFVHQQFKLHHCLLKIT